MWRSRLYAVKPSPSTSGAQLPVNICGIPDGFDEVSALESLLIDGEPLTSLYGFGGALLGVGAAVQLDARPSPERGLLLTVPADSDE